ncbi:MAG TPA: hypothetical protein VF629_07060 [Hymenobacter sp.]|uniref:hypothetical protein n=1 Tax=Hymenobacter sp. TaxID=1898978 RepID=UPI002ED84CC2
MPLIAACTHAESYDRVDYLTTAVERPKTAEELRAELLERERTSPEEYLTVEGTYRRNFINQLVLEGDITNQATMAKFKDPVLTVTWYSATDTELETKSYSVFEYVRPHGSAHFKLKTEAPSYVAKVGMSIFSATPLK